MNKEIKDQEFDLEQLNELNKQVSKKPEKNPVEYDTAPPIKKY